MDNLNTSDEPTVLVNTGFRVVVRYVITSFGRVHGGLRFNIFNFFFVLGHERDYTELGPLWLISEGQLTKKKQQNWKIIYFVYMSFNMCKKYLELLKSV